MANRSNRRRWAAVVGLVGCLVVSLVASLVACGTTTSGSNGIGWTAFESTALSLRPGPSTPAGGVPAAPVRVLQLNLCSSGIAACYTGRSTAEAAAVIRAETPDLVTLNEVCQDDVSTLQRALADVVPGGAVVSAFQAARDGRTGDAYRCRNGQQYGIGLVSRWPSVPGSSAGGGIYPTQDSGRPRGAGVAVSGRRRHPGRGRLHHAPGLHQAGGRGCPVQVPVRHGHRGDARAGRGGAAGAGW